MPFDCRDGKLPPVVAKLDSAVEVVEAASSRGDVIAEGVDRLDRIGGAVVASVVGRAGGR